MCSTPELIAHRPLSRSRPPVRAPIFAPTAPPVNRPLPLSSSPHKPRFTPWPQALPKDLITIIDHQPTIVLVRPQLGQNIGMCARSMLNCGLDKLRLVSPRDGWPSDSARATSADADQVIGSARCFDSLPEALADCHRVFATTARNRSNPLPQLDVTNAARQVAHLTSSDTPPHCAVLFGPEASGLDADDLACADTLIHVPLNPTFSSLNLAQAVLLFAWEWRKETASAPPLGSSLPVPADKSELLAYLARLESELSDRGFFPSTERRPDTLRQIAGIVSRSNPSDRELRMLHGILTTLTSPPR